MIEDEKVINIASLKGFLEKTIDDNDINALFFGLVRLIKKKAISDVDKELKQDYFEATENFRQTLIDLNRVESLLKKEQEKNFELQKKLDLEQQKYCCYNNFD